jgi:5'-methylthioadenosine phosphorylase
VAAQKTILGIIGGSGLYQIDGLTNTRWQAITSPFGAPSDALFFGELAGIQLVFLPRHGRGHKYSPSGINYRANIDVLKRAGVTDIISLSACGSLRENLPPGTFVIVDQFIDRTFAREKSFFGDGLVAHVSMAEPVCRRLGDSLEAAAKTLGLKVVRGGTYLAMEGPQFSTKAESEFYRQASLDVIGMTNMPEAKLAREAEICYATVAMVTDFDCWHPDHDHVQVSDIIKTLLANADHARALVRAAAPDIVGGAPARQPCPQGCDRALDMALITAPEARDNDMMRRLDAVAGRVLKGEKNG